MKYLLNQFIIAKGKGFDVELPLKSDIKYPNYRKVISNIADRREAKKEYTLTPNYLTHCSHALAATALSSTWLSVTKG